jgi:hypothetical protein
MAHGQQLRLAERLAGAVLLVQIKIYAPAVNADTALFRLAHVRATVPCTTGATLAKLFENLFEDLNTANARADVDGKG